MQVERLTAPPRDRWREAIVRAQETAVCHTQPFLLPVDRQQREQGRITLSLSSLPRSFKTRRDLCCTVRNVPLPTSLAGLRYGYVKQANWGFGHNSNMNLNSAVTSAPCAEIA